MTGRVFTVELTEEQARIVREMAETERMTPDAVLIEAIGHGFAMIVAGVNDSDLIEPWDRKGPASDRTTEGRAPVQFSFEEENDLPV